MFVGSIYHLRTEEQYPRGLPHESTVQGTYMSLARWNSTPNKYLPLRVIRSLIQASFLHFGDCTQRYPLKGCGAVWRPAGDADQKMETQPRDTSSPGYHYFYYYYYYSLIMVGITRSKVIFVAS